MPIINSVVSSTDESFAYDLGSYKGLPVLVEFFAGWADATSNREVLEGLAQYYKGKLGVLRLDVEKYAITPRVHEIRGVPTLIVFQNSQEAGRVVGTVQRSRLTRFLRPYLQPKGKGVPRAATEVVEYRYRANVCTCP